MTKSAPPFDVVHMIQLGDVDSGVGKMLTFDVPQVNANIFDVQMHRLRSRRNQYSVRTRRSYLGVKN